MEKGLSDLLVKGASHLGVRLNPREVMLFERYLTVLLEFNEKTNLTAIRDQRGVIIKHFLDSLAIIPFLPEGNLRILDVGTGGGFPGVPIKILCPQTEVVLLDSVRKKVDFLNSLVDELGLIDVIGTFGRAEELAQLGDFRETFDIVVSRAVSELVVLVELCLPFVRVGGQFIAYKGLKAEEELENAMEAISLLGGQVVKNETIVLPELEGKRVLVFMEKIASSPAKYPRRVGVPEKKPLRKGLR